MMTRFALTFLTGLMWLLNSQAQEVKAKPSLSAEVLALRDDKKFAEHDVVVAERLLKSQTEITQGFAAQLEIARRQNSIARGFSGVVATRERICKFQRDVVANHRAYNEQYKIDRPALDFKESSACTGEVEAPSAAAAPADIAKLEAAFHKAQHESVLRLLDLQKAKILRERAELEYLTARQSLAPDRPVVLMARQAGLEAIQLQLTAVLNANVEGTSPLLLQEVRKRIPEVNLLITNFCGKCSSHDPVAVLNTLRDQFEVALSPQPSTKGK